MRTVGIIQSRMSSTRLPGKALLPIGNHPLLWHVVYRVQQAMTLDSVIVATGDLPANDSIVELCWAEGWQCERGPEEDVLARYYQAAHFADASVIVRITGDCPLHSWAEIDRVVNQLWDWRLDYVSNCHPPRLPDGLDTEVMTFRSLERAHQTATLPSDREHVTSWLRRNLPGYAWASLGYAPDLSRFRLCVDEQADLDVVRAIFGALGEDCTWQQAVRWLSEHPEVAALNQGIRRNEAYAKSLKADQSWTH